MGAHPYRVPATPPSPKRTRRIAGSTVVAVGALTIMLVPALLWLGMRRTETASEPVPAPPVITNLPDMPEVLFEGSWPDLDVRLIGVDVEKKTALLKLVQHGSEPRLVYSTVDWEKKAFVEQWEATHENAKKLVQEYPAAFNPISGDFTGDLVKLAGLFRRHAFDGAVAFGADPMMAVSKDGAIVYDRIPTNGHDGDELWMVDAEGKNARRIDVGLVASYDPVFSPDGEWVAMRSCGRPCDYYLHVVDVKHARAPIRVSVANNPRRHVFSADGKSVFVLTRHTEDQAAFWEVPLDAPGNTRKLYDNPKMKSAELYVSPDHKTAVVAGRQRFVFFDLEKREIFRDRLLDAGNLLSMGPNGMLLASDRAGTLFYDPRSEKQTSLANDTWYLQAFWGAWEAPGVAMAVRAKAPTFQLVRLDARQRF